LLRKVLTSLLKGIKLVGISPEDLWGGHIKLELGLIWTFICRYQFPEAKLELLAWVSDQVKDLVPKERVPTNFSSDWTDGLLLSALVRKSLPGNQPLTGMSMADRFYLKKNGLLKHTRNLIMASIKLRRPS